MKTRLILIALLANCGLLIALYPASKTALIPQAQAACDPVTSLDKTTLGQIRDKLVNAGYKNPLHLRKGCDSAWHGSAIKDGQQINVAVTPDGNIVQEGD